MLIDSKKKKDSHLGDLTPEFMRQSIASDCFSNKVFIFFK